MAFKNGLSERLDELRFPSPRSPPSESSFPGYGSLSPGHSNFVSAFSRPPGDVRSNIQRRFTTDSSKLSSWNYLNHGASPMPDPLDMMSSVSLASFRGPFCWPVRSFSFVFFLLEARLDLLCSRCPNIISPPSVLTVPCSRSLPLICFPAGQSLLQVPACEP